MKKLFSVLLCISLLLCTVSPALAQSSEDSDFDITSDGEITAYYGDVYVEIPEVINGITVKKIADKAFFDLGIERVNIVANIEQIGDSAFEGTTIYEINIPDSTHTIGAGAFKNCANISYVYMYSATGDINFGPEAFANTGRIAFYVMCSADIDTLAAKIVEAKGDRNFDLITAHDGLFDTYFVLGSKQFSVSKCADCNYFYLNYPGPLGHPFYDVDNSMWYASYVDAAYNTTIINGKADGVFDPDATMTCAEAAKIAACIHALINGNNISAPESDAWYVPYVDYCYNYGILDDYIKFEWTMPITRAQMAYVFSRADTGSRYINDVPITDIPDVHDNTAFVYNIMDLYNKGVAVGDETMSYHPDDYIKRSEVSAIISRILFAELRVELPKG